MNVVKTVYTIVINSGYIIVINYVDMIVINLVKNAKWVLALDADFNDRAYDFLKIIKNEKPKVIVDIKIDIIVFINVYANEGSICLYIRF